MAGTVTASILKNDVTTPTVFQNSAGTEIGKLARAWVQFTVSGTTPTINASFNVSSVTYVTTGQFTITFVNNMPSASYAVEVAGSINTASSSYCSGMAYGQANSPFFIAPTASTMSVQWTNFTTNQNPLYGNVIVFA